MTHVYGNLANSGMKSTDGLKASDRAGWKTSNGELKTFDQTPFIEAAVAEHAKVSGGSANVDHRIDKTRAGYYYVPTACGEGKAVCKFAMISHGAGG